VHARIVQFSSLRHVKRTTDFGGVIPRRVAAILKQTELKYGRPNTCVVPGKAVAQSDIAYASSTVNTGSFGDRAELELAAINHEVF